VLEDTNQGDLRRRDHGHAGEKRRSHGLQQILHLGDLGRLLVDDRLREGLRLRVLAVAQLGRSIVTAPS
jgi:hypothetical protein